MIIFFNVVKSHGFQSRGSIAQHSLSYNRINNSGQKCDTVATTLANSVPRNANMVIAFKIESSTT